MKKLHKSLCMTDAFPVLPNTSFFRRFDGEVVENRRQSALRFLEYLGQHFQLFTAREFIKFFEVCFKKSLLPICISFKVKNKILKSPLKVTCDVKRF